MKEADKRKRNTSKPCPGLHQRRENRLQSRKPNVAQRAPRSTQEHVRLAEHFDPSHCWRCGRLKTRVRLSLLLCSSCLGKVWKHCIKAISMLCLKPAFVACLFTRETIVARSRAFYRREARASLLQLQMPAVLVKSEQTPVIKQPMEAFHFPFHPTTRLVFFRLYCGETFTRPSF